MDTKAISSGIAQAIASNGLGKAGAGKGAGFDFVTTLDNALQAVSKTQAESADLQRRFQLDDPGVGLEETMLAMSKSQLSFQAAVQVRNKLVQAYESVMNMPV